MQISVVGTHAYAHAPERASVHVTVDVEGPDRAATSADAAAVRDTAGRALQALRDQADSPLVSFTIGPVVTRSWRPHHDRGQIMPLQYGASAAIRATFAAFAPMADLMNDWAGRDGVRLEHVEWTLTDPTRREIEAEALAHAVDEARSRALAIARASGFADVEVVEVADPGLLGSDHPPQPRGGAMRSAMLMADAGGADGPGLVPEDIRGEARVHARFVASRESG